MRYSSPVEKLKHCRYILLLSFDMMVIIYIVSNLSTPNHFSTFMPSVQAVRPYLFWVNRQQ